MQISQTGLIPSSFQRVLLQALRDPGLIWIPAFDGTSIGRGSLFGDNVFIQLHGADIAFDFESHLLTGTITSIEISGSNDTEPESVATGVEIDFSVLQAAIEGDWTGFGGADYNAFVDVLMEPNNRLTGSDGRDVLEPAAGATSCAPGQAGT